MINFTFFNTRFVKSGMYFMLTAYLNSDYLHYMVRGYHVGQFRID